MNTTQAEFTSKVKELRRLQRMKDRYPYNSLSTGERAKLARLEKWVDEYLKEVDKVAGVQAKAF